MKRLIITAVMGAGFLLLSNCAPHIGTIVTSQPVPTKEEVSTQFTAEQLAQGRTVWENNCANCHKLYPADKHDAAGWNKTLKRMIHRAKMTEEEGTLVRAYLISKSR